jgi:hypothetical protein
MNTTPVLSQTRLWRIEAVNCSPTPAVQQSRKEFYTYGASWNTQTRFCMKRLTARSRSPVSAPQWRGVAVRLAQRPAIPDRLVFEGAGRASDTGTGPKGATWMPGCRAASRPRH